MANAVYSAFDKARFCPAEKDGKVSYDLGFPVVAKFFEYSGDDKEKRYNSVNCNRK